MEIETRPGVSPRERSLGELFKDLAAESSQLMRHELALARAEMRQSIGELKRHATGVAVGGAVAGVGGLVLVAFVVALLGELLGGNYWLSALIVGAVMAGAGVWLTLRAVRGMRSVSLAPQRTLSTLRTTGSWAGEEAAELRDAFGGGTDGDARAGVSRAGARPVAASTRNRVAHLDTEPAVRSHDRGKGSGGGKLALLKTVGKEIQADDITGQAAKVAYYAFLSMPPALMAVFALAGLFGGMDLAQTIEREAQLVMPESVMESIIRPFISDVVLSKAPGPLSIGLLLALWGASSVFANLMSAMNVAYDVEETRSFVKQRAVALGVMAGGAGLFLLAAGVLLGGPALAAALGLGATGDFIWALLQWPLAFAFMVVAFWIGYYFLPDRDQAACKKLLLKAAAVAALLWVLATAGFRIYIANFSSYSEAYGFLGAFIVLLLWLYVTGIVVLAGAELASEMEKQ